jgi:2-polyprenyl-3-methyl-5-hydroxy-6-metoxy-1,4-benzoquinol methylase
MAILVEGNLVGPRSCRIPLPGDFAIDDGGRPADYEAMDDRGDHSWLKRGGTSSGEVAKTYDDWAASYERTLADWDYRAPADAAQLLRARAPAGAAILDAGCGTGLTGMALRRAGFRGPIDGIDISLPSLREAEKHGLYRTLEPADLQQPPLAVADAAYDALICIGVLTYVRDSAACLREFARIVRPGGTVLISQRDDLFADRAFAATISALAGAGVFSGAAISGPQPYLPANPDFGADIQVIYATLTVAG